MLRRHREGTGTVPGRRRGRWSARLEQIARELPANLHVRLALANLIGRLLPWPVGPLLRARCYRLAGLRKVHHSAFIMSNLELISGQPGMYEKLVIGPGAVIGHHVTINLDAQVALGSNVSLGPFVRLYTGTHQIGPGSNRRVSALLARPVRIGDGCWIGLGAVILPGVTIGRGCIVAAGAVVGQDVPPNSYVEGNPSRVTRQLPWGDR